MMGIYSFCLRVTAVNPRSLIISNLIFCFSIFLSAMSFWDKEGKVAGGHRPGTSGGAAGPTINFGRAKDGVNPLFRGRRHAPEMPNKKTYPDPSIAIPYLPVTKPTEAEKQSEDEQVAQRYSSSSTLLGQYWSANHNKLKTMKDFDGRKPTA